MQWERPNSLGKTVAGKASNRPIKVAYLVPFDDAPRVHLVLDGVFFESYTRWGGVYTLLVPTTADHLMIPGFQQWLERYDPDFIYSFVGLSAGLTDLIDRLCCPIAMLEHKMVEGTENSDWRSFLPKWDHYFQAVSSISTVQSPSGYPQYPHEDRPREPTVLTQYAFGQHSRFLADNFGSAFSIHASSNPVPGFFRTLCLVPADLPENHRVGSERCTTPLDAFRAVSNRKATPISLFATINSSGIRRQESAGWTNSFQLIVGGSPLDRINFWNSRHLGNSWSDGSNALLVSREFFDDAALVRQLGDYFNKNNFLGGGSGPCQVQIHSHSLPVAELDAIRDLLKAQTHNAVYVSKTPSDPALPTKKELEDRAYFGVPDTTTIRLTENDSELVANDPAHFMYLPPQLRGLANGQWVVELSIQRHNNLSRYSNVIDTWSLPHRLKIARAFTKRLAKATVDGRLALIPAAEGFPVRGHAVKSQNLYELMLPTDEVFFRHLALDCFHYATDDMRAHIAKAGYVDLGISDKGQNLRGVVSLLGDLPTAFEILTKKYWRSVLAEAKEDSKKPRLFTWKKLESFLPNSSEELQQLAAKESFVNVGETIKYLKQGLADTLEHLVRRGVFYQVAYWKCRYCGHSNTRSFDDMKLKNACSICATEHFANIDLEWEYELNEFVHRSLYKHHGLIVLWTLGYLQESRYSGAFWYLPEVDLFESHDSDEKNEIDALCMLDGIYYAIEVKSSVTMFLNKEGSVDKFARIIQKLRPDVALLSFERYNADSDDVEDTKRRLGEALRRIRAIIGEHSKLETLVAEDFEDYRDFSVDLGWHGKRLRRLI